MKVSIVADTSLRGWPLAAGQLAIVSDADGAFLVEQLSAVAISEGECGVFCVPMPGA